MDHDMGNSTIFVRLLGEAVDCWRPVAAIDHSPSGYRIVGPEPTPDEEWEFRIGEVVRCRERDGQLIAVKLIEAARESTDPQRPLTLSGCWRAARRMTNTIRKFERRAVEPRQRAPHLQC
jgi:hypothetical protein